MKIRSRGGALRHILSILWSLAVATSPALIQQTSAGSRGDQDNENRLLLPAYEREELDRRGRTGGRQPSAESRLAQSQIIEDFRRLQLLNNQVRLVAAQQGARDKGLIKPLGEIRKRAKRLKANLALAAVEGEGGSSELRAEADLESLLSRLDQSVKTFVRNPMFRSTKVVDVGLARIARVDLERVIELSRAIADHIRTGPR